jgi:crotonobetainyl-CoA:carnitine CoA-transferase CaiB-like acyl-CoA transferase
MRAPLEGIKVLDLSRVLAGLPHPELGRVTVLRSPFRFSGADLADPTHPPLLGEHTGEVLRRVLGVPPPELAALHEAGVLYDAALGRQAERRA